jgi:hypothetical protein
MDEFKDSSKLLWKRGPVACRLIGDPDCPILKRWTLDALGRKWRLHKFFPNTKDRDTHDHPWPFLTICLAGEYKDVRLDGHIDRIHRGSIRYRSATHAHQTFAGPKGCWTIVIGPKPRRDWGFFPDGKWLFWKEYMAKFGHGMSCDD